MDKKKIAIFLLLIGLWFYWFQWRPARIRKECWQYAQDHIKIESEKLEDFNKYTKAVNFVFDDCLKMKGLE